MVKNFIKMISNPEIINPTVYLTPEIVEYEDKQIIHIHVPPSSEVHSYKKVIYDRVDDADVKELVAAISRRDWKKACFLEARTLLRLAA